MVSLCDFRITPMFDTDLINSDLLEEKMSSAFSFFQGGLFVYPFLTTFWTQPLIRTEAQGAHASCFLFDYFLLSSNSSSQFLSKHSRRELSG